MTCAIVNLKAFGDFVISCNAIRQIQSTSQMHLPFVVAGEHVRSLASALGLEAKIHFIGDATCNDVPAAFDLRKRGMLRAFLSLHELRQRVADLTIDTEFIFDNAGWREWYLSQGRVTHFLQASSGNIYLAYDQILELLGYKIRGIIQSERHVIKSAIIIPGARLPHKIIPSGTINTVTAELTRNNIQVNINVLEGELYDLPKGVGVKTLPRSFKALVAAIEAADFVVSADSLPSHLAEFLEKPVFVSTPAPNPYWLPRSAYLTNGWATFESVDPLRLWLANHLSTS